MAKRKQDDRIRNFYRTQTQIKIYKDMVVTYREFFEALKQLGYKDQSNDTHFRFMSPEDEGIFNISKTSKDGSIRTLDHEIWTPNFFTDSQTLYLLYEINDIDDLAKMIEKNREKAKEKEMSEAIG